MQDYFSLIPNDITNIIFSFLDSIKDSFSLLVVCKRFHQMLKPNEQHWKRLCLEFWSTIWNHNLSAIQGEGQMKWFWVSHCFANELFSNNDGDMMIGTRKYGIKVQLQDVYIGSFDGNNRLNGHGMWYDGYMKYVGQLEHGRFEGPGTLTYSSEVKYEGIWCDNTLHGHGTITYSDGISYQGEWDLGRPLFDVKHPLLKKCI
jgi:hypothetical protein